MKSKIFSLFALSIFTLLILTSLISALKLTPSTNTISLDNSTLVVLNISEAGDVEFSFTNSNVLDSSGKSVSEITFTPRYANSSLVGNNSTTMNYNISGNIEFKKQYHVVITATDDSSNSASTTLYFEENDDFCTYDGNDFDEENENYLRIKKIEFTNNGFGDENEWYPFDEIEVSVTVKAPDDDVDLEDIKLEWGLYDEDSKDWVIEVDDEDEFDLDGGDDTTITFTFKLDDEMDMDLDELDSGNLKFYVRVTGTADSDDDNDLCTFESKDIDFKIDKFVLLDNIKVVPDNASCGSELDVTADVWNIDDSKQKDVSVVIYNKELGINKQVEIGDIDKFDSVELSTTIVIPDNAAEKTYSLTFYVYDKDEELYEIDDEESIFNYFITVNKCSTTPTAIISPSLESEAKAGKELIVKATIFNSGSSAKTFKVSASYYAGWASSVKIDSDSVTLNPGESKDVFITLNVNEDVSGQQQFNIELLEGDKFLSQPVKIEIEKPSSFLTGFISGNSGKIYLCLIIGLNIVLIAGIIFVSVRIPKKKKSKLD